MALYDELDDTVRGFTAQGGQLNIWDDTLKAYVLFIPVETLPSVVGNVNTVENDVTTSNAIGKIKGKMSIDDKDVSFLWHRDNLVRLNEYLGKKCKFLVSYPDGTGWKFTSEYTYKPDDSSASEKVTGTLTLISSEVDDTATLNVRDLMAKTITITSALPSEITLTSASKTGKYTLTSGTSGVTYKVSSDVSNITASVTAETNSSSLSIATTATSNTNGVVTVYAEKSGMASWKYSILVNYEA